MHERSGSILKRDAVGRVVTPGDKRESLLDEFERSALSGAEFARVAGVKYQTFAGWVQRRRHARGEYGVRKSMSLPEVSGSALRLVEAVVSESLRAPASQAVALEVRLPGGGRTAVHTGAEVALLAQLLKAIEGTC
jgi:hypothetical protein